MIFSVKGVIVRLTRAQTFTVISLNNSQYILKTSVVCSLHFTAGLHFSLSLHFISGLQSNLGSVDCVLH